MMVTSEAMQTAVYYLTQANNTNLSWPRKQW